jgi:hypothetical protein
VRVYLAGPLFSAAERAYLEELAGRIRDAGISVFLPHVAAARLSPVTPQSVFALDEEGLRSADALVAWLDGPMVDDGTACEIGLFLGLMRAADRPRKGILGLATDLRLERRRPHLGSGSLNMFVAGAIEAAGRICWSREELLERLRALKEEGDEGGGRETQSGDGR